jgi:23S rRNA U2552 (ribose-2'-O)-methylase RlmE/FtsJ
VFDGEDAPSFVSEVRAAYGKVARMRPEAVRQASREFFIVGLDRRAAGG